MPCTAPTTRASDKPAIAASQLHRIHAEEQDTPAISPAEAMGWSVAVWAAVALIVALLALMNLPMVAWIFS